MRRTASVSARSGLLSRVPARTVAVTVISKISAATPAMRAWFAGDRSKIVDAPPPRLVTKSSAAGAT
jgi:hypothetical protein